LVQDIQTIKVIDTHLINLVAISEPDTGASFTSDRLCLSSRFSDYFYLDDWSVLVGELSSNISLIDLCFLCLSLAVQSDLVVHPPKLLFFLPALARLDNGSI
jgi:hypothetical protein